METNQTDTTHPFMSSMPLFTIEQLMENCGNNVSNVTIEDRDGLPVRLGDTPSEELDDLISAISFQKWSIDAEYGELTEQVYLFSDSPDYYCSRIQLIPEEWKSLYVYGQAIMLEREKRDFTLAKRYAIWLLRIPNTIRGWFI